MTALNVKVVCDLASLLPDKAKYESHGGKPLVWPFLLRMDRAGLSPSITLWGFAGDAATYTSPRNCWIK